MLYQYCGLSISAPGLCLAHRDAALTLRMWSVHAFVDLKTDRVEDWYSFYWCVYVLSLIHISEPTRLA